MYEQRIIVAGMSWNTSEQELYQYFAKAGKVNNVRIFTDAETGESLGTALVTMQQTSKAVNQLKGATIDGKKVSITVESPEDQSVNRMILAAI